MEFDGSGDWLIFPSGEPVNFGTGDFTIECWFYTSTTTRGVLVSNRQAQTDATSFTLQYVNQKIYFSNSATDFLISTATLSLNTWYHIAVSRASGTMRLFLDGVIDDDLAGNTTNFDMKANYRIGAEPYNNQYPLNGYIDDFRVTKGVARYTANFTAPTKAFPDQ
jgi:hypothetical protein